MENKILFNISNNFNQKTIIKELANLLIKNNVANTNSSEVLEKLFNEREQQGSTNLDEGFAMPHIINDGIKESTITILRFKKPVVWGNSKSKKITFLVAISLPANQGKQHLEIISKLSTKLVDKEFVKMLKTASKQKIITNVSNVLYEKPVNNANQTPAKEILKTGAIKIVAISTCPTGVAHTHMAAEQLEKAAKYLKINLKVEKQAAEGVVNGLTAKEIEEADYCLFALGKNINRDRFVGKKCYEVPIAEAIKDPVKVLKQCQEQASTYASKGLKNTSSGGQDGVKQRHTNPIMNALMNGISYMIPIIITGGILLALSIGIGAAVYGSPAAIPPNSFFGVIESIGGVAFTVMIPVLGAYIAYAIGDKAAMAPAFILSLFCNTITSSTDKTANIGFWNWQNMTFGNFASNNPPVLGFFGAIAVGLLVGYMVKYMKLINWPKQIRAIVPIFIIPITTTLVLWAFIAFFGYLPLFYLSYGLRLGIEDLVHLNLFWLVGILLGAMIAFDMGGPVNKVAFLIGSGFIGQGNGLLMGANAAAISVPPLGLALGAIFNHYVFKRENHDDLELAKTAGIIGCLGITEGAIPFVVKNPRLIIANVIGGMVAGGIAGALFISDSVAHGGLIVYLLGAIGHQSSITDPLKTDYVYGLWFVLALLLGCLTTAGLSVALYKKPVMGQEFASVLE